MTAPPRQSRRSRPVTPSDSLLTASPVRLGASAPCDDDGSDEAGIDVDAFVIVGMVEPDYGAEVKVFPSNLFP
jgi:hypothetical protein